MNPLRTPAAAAAALVALAAAPAQAQVFGSLSNFDAVNDTGQIAHGFEIQIEDASYDHTKIFSVFGLDRNFGVPPASVERYGAPTITDLPGIGVSVRYQASFANGQSSVGTPTGPYPFAGDSCWPLGNAQYNSGTLTCDHFGVATYGNPARVTYNWLVDPSNTGALSSRAAGLPPVNWAYQPPPAGQQGGGVVAEIDAHKEANEVFGMPFWVKIFSNHANHAVELDNLLKGKPNVPGDQQVEAEFEIFQAGDANEKKFANIALNPADAALVLRYECYTYQGALTAEGEALCGGHGAGKVGPADCGGLGDFVGAQIAGFNVVQAPVPEPATWALWLAGLGSIGFVARRRS